jgi:thioredoxin reductase
MKTIAVLGAGPVGLEAAHLARRLGFETYLLERGDVADNVLAWGHVHMFSPWRMNVSELGIELLGGADLPWDECPTGREYAERYLLPLARLPALRGRVHAGERVVAVSRAGTLKGDLIGGPRHERPFRILTEDRAGRERTRAADVVLDCTGVYRVHNWLGDGGIPAPGERGAAARISYELDDVLGVDRERYQGKRTLLVGDGLSAAQSAVALADLSERAPGTRVVWAARRPAPPIPVVPDDPLPERARLARSANDIAAGSSPAIRFMGGAVVDALDRGSAGLRVRLRAGEEHREESVDRILANVGYGPDNSLYRELQVHECYASRGPMKLAAALLADGSADCLAQKSHGPDALCNPEPGFFILGMKSYGRNSAFLVRQGFAQVREVFSLLQGG